LKARQPRLYDVEGVRAHLPRLQTAARRWGRGTSTVLARTLAKDWTSRDETVATRLHHDANIAPWALAARHAGATIRWADFEPQSGELPSVQIERVLNNRTRWVAITAASDLIGTSWRLGRTSSKGSSRTR
jgi:selenocysteine lyase/cysteine desulfurase